MPLPDLFTAMPYLGHMAGWDIFNRIKNYFYNTVLRIFVGSNGFMLQPQGYVYTGDVIGLCMAMASAAWVAWKAVDQSVNSIGTTKLGFAATYRYPGVVNWDLIGLFENLTVVAFMLWAWVLIILSFVFYSILWETIEAREHGVVTDGSGGVALDEFQSLKLFVLCILVGMMSIVGAYSIGETADELIAWFDNIVANWTSK